MSTRRTIVKAAGIIMLGNIASRLLGVAREQVIAALFGATGTTDAFVAASTVPTVVYDLLIGGAISAALIPVFSDYADDPARGDDLSRVAGTILTLVTLALAVIIVILIAFAPALIAVLGTGLAPNVQEQAISLVRLMLPAVLFMGLAGILTALLYARQRFTLPAFTVAAYNASVIVLALLLAGQLGVTSLVAGVLVGAFLQIALQLPGVRGMSLRPMLDLAHPGLRRALKLYAPVAAGLIISIVAIFIDRNLASRTGEGNMAAMRFATTLIQFPLGLVATALSYAILPTLSRHAAPIIQPSNHSTTQLSNHPTIQLSDYKTTLALGIKLAMLAMLPATVGLVVLRVPLVRLLFEHGRFDAYDTARTALAFLAYSPQLPFVALDQLFIVAFYARKNTIVPVTVGAVSVGIYLVIALALIEAWGFVGLAFANAVQNSAHGLILLALLWRAIGGLRGYGLSASIGKILLAALVTGLVTQGVSTFSGLESASGLAKQLAWLLVAASAGAGAYAVTLLALRGEEAKLVWDMIWGRLRGVVG